MRDAKYDDIIYYVEMLCNNDNIDFDETIAEMLVILEDYEATKHTVPLFWQNLIEICENSKNIPLMLAIMKNPNAPTICTDEISTMHDGEFLPYTVVSENITSNILANIMYKIGIDGMKGMLEYDGESFSRKSIDLLCKLPQASLEEMEYYPFAFVNKNCDTYDLLSDMIENENDKYFKGEVPTDFLYYIARNSDLDDDIRNQAFDKWYTPEDLYNITMHMAKEIYKSCAETIFDFVPETKEDKEAQGQADTIINSMVVSNQLPMSCRLDFMKRLASVPNQKLYSTESILMSDNNQSVIMETALEIPSKTIFDTVERNRPLLTESTISEMLRKKYPEEIMGSFISSTLRHTSQPSTVKKFLKKDTTIVEIALMSSYHTLPKVLDMLIKANQERTIKKVEVDYLRKVRDFIFENFLMPEAQNLMNNVVYHMITNSELYKVSNAYQMPNTSAKRLLDEVSNSKEWCRIPDDKIDGLRALFNDLKAEYPKYKEATTNIVSDIEIAYKKSQLPNKYPYIFSKPLYEQKASTSWWKVSYFDGTVFPHINFNAMKKWKKEDMQGFIEEVKQCNDLATLTALLNVIKNNISNRELLTLDEVHKNIYKFADLYNAISEQITKTRQREEDIDSDLEYALPF